MYRETHDNVTVFFSDIIRFTDISRALSPVKVCNMLDRLYVAFDALAGKHEVFKVETIGDAWMGVTNCMYRLLIVCFVVLYIMT
jgi:class 3 adenylate cyclase